MSGRGRLMLVTGILASACVYFGVQEYQLSAKSSAEPEEITLRQLIQRGAQGNPHVIITEFEVFEDYIYKSRLGTWTKVWVPVVPADDESADESQAAIKVFLYGEDVAGEAGARQRFNKPKLRGMVDPDASKPGIIGSILIKRRYPGTDSSKCLIIVEGKQPAGIFKLGLFAVGFVLLAGLTGAIWYIGRLMDKAELESESTGKKKRSGNDDDDVAAESIFIED